jgi:hypothetical protein
MNSKIKLVAAAVVLLIASNANAQSTTASNILTGTQTAPTQYLGSSTLFDVLFKTNNIERMRIQSSTGNIGIGTTGLLTKLNVNGNALFTSSTGSPGSAPYIRGNGSMSAAATPDYTFWNNDQTGMFHPGQDILGFTTTGTERMRIDANGNIGIGSNLQSPLSLGKLQVSVGSTINNTPDNIPGVYISKQTAVSTSRKMFLVPHLSGWGYNQLSRDGDMGLFWSDGGTTLTAGFVIAPWGGSSQMGIRITPQGNVGIGVALDGATNPNNYKLAVNGTIGAKAVKVELSQTPWPDYVFENEYTMQNINELEAFLKTNKHLPNVPSAKEIEKDGIDMATMDAKLLEKIEELSLYIIEQNKRIETLEKKIETK